MIVQLRPTTPLRPPGLIEKAIQLLENNQKADCLRSINSPAYYPYKMWKKENGDLKPFIQLKDKESYNLPRQKLPKVYYHDGLLDIIRTSTVLEKRSVSGEKILPIITDDSFGVVDIDKPIDFLLAETFYKYNKSSKLLERFKN